MCSAKAIFKFSRQGFTNKLLFFLRDAVIVAAKKLQLAKRDDATVVPNNENLRLSVANPGTTTWATIVEAV